MMRAQTSLMAVITSVLHTVEAMKKVHTGGQQLTQYAHTHNFTIHGNLLEILWIDIHTTSNESEYITQLQLPIK